MCFLVWCHGVSLFQNICYYRNSFLSFGKIKDSTCNTAKVFIIKEYKNEIIINMPYFFIQKLSFAIICIPYLSWSHINITLLIIGWMKYSSKKYYYKYRKQLVKKKCTYSLKAFDIKPNVNNNCLLTEFSTTHYISKWSRVKKIETESNISQNQDSKTIFF